MPTKKPPSYLWTPSKGWKSPDAHDVESFGVLPQTPGLYLLVKSETVEEKLVHKVLYVGMSVNLAKRFIHHHIQSLLHDEGINTQIWFRPCSRDALRRQERKLIHRHDPPYNLQNKLRGGIDG